MIRSETRSVALGFCLVLILVLQKADAQYVPGVNNNLTLQSNLHEYARYSNLWGYVDSSGNEYALLGTDAGLSIVDVTNPASPVEITLIPGPTNVPGATIWREVKTRGTYAYVVSEHMVPNNLSGLQIIDLSGLPGSATLVRNYRWPNVDSTNARAHTVTIDDAGYLYIQGGTATLGTGGHQGGIRIFSLDDPENPNPLSVFDPRYVHDVFIRNDVLFSSNIFDGGHIDILDVSDRSNPQLIVSHVYPNGFSHNSFATEDDQYLFSTDEVTGLTMKVFDIGVIWDADTTNDDQITQVADYIGDSTQIAHEIFIRGDYGFLSHYVEGVKILDISDPTNPVEVAYYDTYLQPGDGFNGDWGVYPFLPSGNILVSDIQTGLYVFQFDSVRAGAVAGVVVDQIGPLQDVTISFVEASKVVTTAGSGAYHFDSNEGFHTLILSKAGYFTDSVSVNILADSVVTLNVEMAPNWVDIDVSVSNFWFELTADTVFETGFDISNAGVVGSVLEYTVDDIFGPLKGIPLKKSRKPVSGQQLLSGITTEGLKRPSTDPVRSAGLVGDTIIVDPAGDLVFGSGGDVVGVYATVTATDVTFDFEFASPPNVDSTYVLFSIDTDFDPMTGANPGGLGLNDPAQNIGAEFDLFINLPALPAISTPANTLSIWVGSNQQPQSNPIFVTGVTVAGNIVSCTVPLSEIADDGNMAIAGNAGHLYPDIVGPASQDLLPDVGHGTIGQDPSGDIPWLTLSVSGGSLQSGEVEAVLVTVNTDGLQTGSNHTGLIVVISNDVNSPIITIPVTLDVVTAIDDHTVMPTRFHLGQNYPNPFNPTTAIRYEVASPGRVVVKIFNVMGQEIRTLVDAAKQAGTYTATWDGNDRYGKRAASGVYFYTMKSDGYFKSRKMLLLK